MASKPAAYVTGLREKTVVSLSVMSQLIQAGYRVNAVVDDAERSKEWIVQFTDFLDDKREAARHFAETREQWAAAGIPPTAPPFFRTCESVSTRLWKAARARSMRGENGDFAVLAVCAGYVVHLHPHAEHEPGHTHPHIWLEFAPLDATPNTIVLDWTAGQFQRCSRIKSQSLVIHQGHSVVSMDEFYSFDTFTFPYNLRL